MDAFMGGAKGKIAFNGKILGEAFFSIKSLIYKTISFFLIR